MRVFSPNPPLLEGTILFCHEENRPISTLNTGKCWARRLSSTYRLPTPSVPQYRSDTPTPGTAQAARPGSVHTAADIHINFYSECSFAILYGSLI